MRVHPDDVKANVKRLVTRWGGREQALKSVLQRTADHITRQRSQYLFWGPYWWVVKALIRKHVGDEKVVRWAGEYDDFIVRQRYATGDDLYDLAAGLLYQADHSGNLADAPERHNIVDDSGDDTQSYTLYDPDLRRG